MTGEIAVMLALALLFFLGLVGLYVELQRVGGLVRSVLLNQIEDGKNGVTAQENKSGGVTDVVLRPVDAKELVLTPGYRKHTMLGTSKHAAFIMETNRLSDGSNHVSIQLIVEPKPGAEPLDPKFAKSLRSRADVEGNMVPGKVWDVLYGKY